MAKGIQDMAGDTKCGSLLAIFCIPTHFVAAPLPYFVSPHTLWQPPCHILYPHTICGGYIIWHYTGNTSERPVCLQIDVFVLDL